MVELSLLDEPFISKNNKLLCANVFDNDDMMVIKKV